MGLLDALATGAAAGFGMASELTAKSAFEQERSRLEEERAQRIMEQRAAIEQRMAKERFDMERGAVQSERERIAGVVKTAREAAMNQGPARASDIARATSDALLQSGDVGQAEMVHRMSKPNIEKLSLGQKAFDLNDDGKVVADNASELIGEIRDRESKARISAAAQKNAPKQLTQQDLDRIVSQADKLVGSLGKTRHPFATNLDDEKAAADTTMQNLLKEKVGTVLSNAAMAGYSLNPATVRQEFKAAAEKADAIAQKEAKDASANYFDSKGRPLDGAVEKLIAAGIPGSATSSASAFMRFYRDERLPETMDVVIAQMRGRKMGAAPTQAPAKPQSASIASQPPKSAATSGPSIPSIPERRKPDPNAIIPPAWDKRTWGAPRG